MADRQLTSPLVSINVPCYHQLDHARRLIACLRAQTLDDLEITLLDDGASDAYRDYVAALGDPRVRYQRNPERLGAMPNMFQAIAAGRGTYSLAFHEDDLVGSHYLATAVSILERDPRCGFVAGELRQFEAEPSAEVLAAPADDPVVARFTSPAGFLREVFRGVEPMFGSIVYRRSALAGVPAPHQEFATLVDRPFLLRILERWSGAIVRDPLVWYRKHGASDDRHLAMNAENIFRLFKVYRAAFPARLSAEDGALFYGYTGYWLFTLYRLLPPAVRPPLRPFVIRAWREGLYDPRWSTGIGKKRLIRLLLTGAVEAKSRSDV
jgi:glycosyltransferase involved in cell wall biosynthesis